MRLRLAVWILVLTVYFLPLNARAQSPPTESAQASPPKESSTHTTGRWALHARPLPACRGFFVTNAGVYLELTRSQDFVLRVRGNLDYGAMVNVSGHDAIGASWFLTVDDDGVATGPVIRYRRWCARERSLDLAVGTPAASGGHTAG